MTEWMTQWNEWLTDWLTEWMNEWLSGMTEWMNELNERIRWIKDEVEWMNERVKRINDGWRFEIMYLVREWVEQMSVINKLNEWTKGMQNTCNFHRYYVNVTIYVKY